MDERSTRKDITGAVLVTGGGIAGMQAALDLAEAGFKVYVSEADAGIGGKMARLDKTFPTNDCSMCIMSPKLVEAGRHLNIDLLPGTKLCALEGEPGRFRAGLDVDGRCVDIVKCTACGDCERACPVDLPDEFDSELGTRKAIYRLYPQVVPNAYTIDKRGISPCRAGCPAGVNTHAYAAMIRSGRYRDALDVIHRQLPFPGVLGRVCPHPCESKCHRAELDASVALCQLKRFVADRVAADEPEFRFDVPEPVVEQRVAVVGAGPSGLACAFRLRQRGVPVTVFERRDVAGGMMTAGIPPYRLPRDVLNRELELVLAGGIEIEYGRTLGQDLSLADLTDRFAATYIAIGCSESTSLDLPGEDLPGVLPGISFLADANLGRAPAVGNRTVVIGGGNTAMDAARTALRLGASRVTIAYRRTEAEITALPEEIAEAREEGIEFMMLTAPLSFTAGPDGRLAGVRMIRNELGEPGADGRRRPVPIAGSEFELAVDTAILAVGQRTVLAGDAPERRRDGTIVTDDRLGTDRPGVYAGGDAVTGPATLIEAVAAGNRAADAISRELGLDVDEPDWPPDDRELAPVPIDEEELAGAPWSRVQTRARAETVHRVPAERLRDFEEVGGGFTEEQARAEAGRCLDCGACCECEACVTACGPDAIDHGLDGGRIELEAGAVILAPGYDLFDPTLLGEYGYGIYRNVMTSLEFERLLSASGPTGGHVVNADDREPDRIAFIQCVGSRDERTAEYCSAVCCMHATKEAIIAREHVPGLAATVFYNDMRAFGKDFERYYERAKSEYGVEYVKCMVSAVKELPSGELVIRYYTPDGTLAEQRFDLVVLSVGLRSSERGMETARAIGVELNDDGFCQTPEFDVVATSRPGVFVAGAFSEPKDIPETVIEASAAAGRAAGLLASARHTLTRVKEYPPERDVSREAPRIGVFVCHCGLNIASVVDVEQTARFAATLPGVVVAEHLLYTCAQDSIGRIKELIAEHNLNRVVVASCTPRTHEPLFRETIREAGLNPYLFELANIREQASWVHQQHPGAATAKARDLVAMAVARSRLLVPLQTAEFDVCRRALVIGAGVSGLSAALVIADQGFDVELIEQQSEPGGLFRDVSAVPGGEDPQAVLSRLIERVSGHPRITVSLNAKVVDTRGYVGNFTSTVEQNGEVRDIDHGAVVIATGGHERKPGGLYGYGSDPRILTLQELEQGGGKAGQSVVFIQCVGSRTTDHPYCSRVCCTSAVKEAIRLKTEDPGRQVTVLFRDVRTYGFRERLYRQARDLGVRFVRYEAEAEPGVAIGDRLRVTVADNGLGEEMVIEADTVILSAGIAPADNGGLSRLFKLPLTADGFFSEAHAKLRPNEFAVEGVFLCGLAHGPRFGSEAMAQGRAAGHKAAIMLSRDTLVGQAIVATTNSRLCRACGLCVEVCPYEARSLDDAGRTAEVREILCMGCGACVVACPSGAAGQRGFERRQILAMIDAAVD